MGLFDSYQFDPASYQGSGGLIDRLLAQLGQQQAYQPNGTGSPQSPMDANAAIQNPPIPVGNIQMPRIGAGFQQDIEPEEPAAPVAAQPGDRMLPKQTPQEQAAGQLPANFFQPQTSPGGFGGALRGALANIQGGPLGLLGGAIAGGLGMGQGTPLQQQQNAAQQKYQALIAAGIPQQKALVAATDPEAAKTILTEAFGKDKFSVVQTGENGLGVKRYEIFNPATGEHKPIAPVTSDESGGLGNLNLTGKDYLASIPAAQRGIVQGVVEGTIPPPTSNALRTRYWQSILESAKNYDPTFDATNWSGRVAGVKDFSSGKSSEMVRSANQTLHHTGQLLGSMDALNNGPYPLINKAGNAISEMTGGGAPTAFRLNAHAVAEELSKVFKGSNLSDAEIRTWEHNLGENMSPEQQRAAVAKLRDLLHGSLQALEEKRLSSIGPMAAEKAGPIIKPEGQKVLQQIDAWLAKSSKAASPTVSGTARTG